MSYSQQTTINSNTMGDATVNGDMPQSAVLNHLQSYPVVSDTIKTVKDNPYGAKSIDLTNAGYAKFVKPTLPYFETPASYAKPYVAKADELGDKFLSKFDEQVPIVKSETKDIQNTVFSYVSWPIVKANDTKDWAFKTYDDEYKKCGGDGVVAGGKAMVTTSLVLTSDMLKWVSSFLQQKKEEAKGIAQEAQQKASQ
ncbi:hypothetical protein PV11_07225 [Exophiala sideris]|uniref:Pathogenesis associated protein Cap20 n=2 Tax=Exophiala sideris TaxID=1016849 RepID=A0A0D1Y9P5_9EURO|nr:hypothetical protein PV11_07225 [Exophiala sideris]